MKTKDILFGIWFIIEMLCILFLVVFLLTIGSLIALGVSEYLKTLFYPRTRQYIGGFELLFTWGFPIGGLWLGLSIGDRWAKWRKL